ncbi:hypothetical protein NliqN6_3304 [Naganishia liquefaciens]|uniref:Enoyl-CoA hydratase/isomerase family protein n=1 Tax=Naganishia liquefaciens TaxID=104408 RepID=A0A8H3TTJ3_9TREE|nr:hypothetical protein NliqN6_3304 [Naganishia liquefaciens]
MAPEQKRLLTITRPSDICWRIAFNAPPDNRLTEDMLGQLLEALDQVELEWRKQSDWSAQFDVKRKGGAVILTSEITKFFSNGLDYENSIKNPNFHRDVFNPVSVRLLTFPMITIAAINGHAFAGGYMMALLCDFRLMTDGKAWCCMNEIDFGAPMPPFFANLLHLRLSTTRSANILRKTLLGHRFTAPELLEEGIVDEIVPAKQLQERAIQFGNEIGVKSKGGSWGEMKRFAYHDAVSGATATTGPLMPNAQAKEFFKRMEEKASFRLDGSGEKIRPKL